MLTKELDHVLKALPSFMRMTSQSSNPLAQPPEGHELTLENVTKAIWFILPFHFLAFVGMVPISADSAEGAAGEPLIVLTIGFATLIGLSWIGTGIGWLTALLRGWKSGDNRRDWAYATWVSALFTAWFFCVLFMSLALVGFWTCKDDFSWSNLPPWPGLLKSLESVMNRLHVPHTEGAVLIVGFPVLAAAVMMLTIPRANRGTWWQWGLLGIICAVFCAAFVGFSVYALQPVTRIAG